MGGGEWAKKEERREVEAKSEETVKEEGGL